MSAPPRFLRPSGPDDEKDNTATRLMRALRPHRHALADDEAPTGLMRAQRPSKHARKDDDEDARTGDDAPTNLFRAIGEPAHSAGETTATRLIRALRPGKHAARETAPGETPGEKTQAGQGKPDNMPTRLMRAVRPGRQPPEEPKGDNSQTRLLRALLSRRGTEGGADGTDGADVNGATRLLRALRPTSPTPGYPGRRGPVHYDSTSAPTQYISVAGLLAPPEKTAPPKEKPRELPEEREPEPPLEPVPAPFGRGSGKLGVLADPLFGPGAAVVAIILWVAGLQPVPPSHMDGLGLFGQLTIPTLLAYPVLLGAVVLELLRYSPRTWVLTGYTLAGVVFVYGLQPAVEEVARLPTSWLHSGFAEYIAGHGEVLQGFDARFSWAGFFSLVAMITKAAGLPNALSLLNWAPVVFAGLMVLGTRALAVSALGNRRASWIAPWLFLVGNWTEQDYFSPQATAMVLMLAALTLTFRHLVRPRLTEPVRARMRARLTPRSSPKARLVAQGSVVLIGLGLAPTHQLTPYLLGFLLILLLLFGRLWPAWLPFVVLGAAVVWFSLGAEDFWNGQLLQMLLAPLGDVGSSVDQGIFARLSGSLGHLVVLLVRIAISGFLVGLAALGILLLRKDKIRSWLLPALCLSPFGIALVQSYGGEVFMRCFLFALPMLALAAGIALERAVTTARRLRRRNDTPHTVAAAAIPWLVLTLLALTTVLARGGNDAYTSMGRDDVAALQWAVDQARPGQRVDDLVNAVPILSSRVGEVEQSEADIYCADLTNVPATVACLAEKGPDYLVVTGPQWAYLKILDNTPDGYPDQLLQGLAGTRLYRVAYDQDGALVLARASAALQNVQPADEEGTG